MEFRVRYDRIADALYIRLREDLVADSEEVAPGVIVDFNARGEIVGIEVLNFSKNRDIIFDFILRGPEAIVLGKAR